MTKMKCEHCGGELFVAHQICRLDVLVDGTGQFVDGVHKDIALDIYDSEHPYGPYQCCGCGAEYDALEDGENSFSGPVEGWSWEQESSKDTPKLPEHNLRYLSVGECSPLYYIVYEIEDGNGDWEIVSGEDAMHVRVDELVHMGISEDSITVFPSCAQL